MPREFRKSPPELVLKAVLQHIDDAVVFKSPDGIITLWNRAAAELFGYTPPEVIGEPADLLIAPKERRHWHQCEKLIRGGGVMCRRVRAVRIGKDGRRIRVTMTATVIDKTRPARSEIMELYRAVGACDRTVKSVS